jgi:aspartyl-tRNA(Asn)/glutamyl-tRNA(Gln) amidotransferase subunit A
VNPKINAYLEVYLEEILKKAQALEEKKEPRGRLAGLPIGIKDMISMRGKQLTASSKMLVGYRPTRSATVTERLEQAGAFFPGRTNCDEFAMGSSNENTPFGAVRNPFDLQRTAGGSSGGSAAVVAAELCVGSLGTDTGGSIRLPAAFCGITGLKPTYGRVSRSGVIAFASSLDQVGPMADDAWDCAEILNVIAGRDSRDATSMPIPMVDYTKNLQSSSLKGLKIGLPKEYLQLDGLDIESARKIQDCLDLFKKEGAELQELSLPHSPYGIAVYYLVATAEASSNLARYDGIRYGHRSSSSNGLKDLMTLSRSEGFGAEVKRRIMLGSFSLSAGYFDAYYAKAQFVRSKIQEEFLSALQKCDLLFIPTSPTPAFKLGEKLSDPLQMYLSDIFTVSINLAGLPAIAFPIGYNSQGLPLGAQFVAGAFQEAKLLEAVAAFERASPCAKGVLAC